MEAVSLSEAENTLSALVERAETTHEIITITRGGRPAAVLMSADNLESLHETIYWLSRSGTSESVADADSEYSADSTMSLDDLRAAYGLPPQ